MRERLVDIILMNNLVLLLSGLIIFLQRIASFYIHSAPVEENKDLVSHIPESNIGVTLILVLGELSGFSTLPIPGPPKLIPAIF